MAKVYVIESDLVGVRPWLMGQIQFFLMLIIPLGSIPVATLGYDWYLYTRYISMPYGLLWKLEGLNISFNTLWGDSYFLVQAIPILVLNIIFVLEIVRYYKALVSRKRVVIVGALSFLIPLIISTISFMVFPISEAYVGPMPFLLIAGLIMLYRIPGPEIEPIEFLSDYIEVMEEEL
ncbi:MAG: hypothetical protein RTU63_07200 [Candidatus Thorarchaeota archaeon]